MCCLGFLACAIGFKKSEIVDRSSPGGVLDELPRRGLRFGPLIKPDGEFCARDSEHSKKLMAINDDEKISERARESRIRRYFAKLGVKVRFVGKTKVPDAK